MIKIRDKSCSSHKSRAWGTSEAEAEQCQCRIHPLDPDNRAVYTTVDTSHKTHYCYTLTLLYISTHVVSWLRWQEGEGDRGRGPGGGGEKTDHYLIIPCYYDRAKLPHRHTHSLLHTFYFSFPVFMFQWENVYPWIAEDLFMQCWQFWVAVCWLCMRSYCSCHSIVI